MIKTGKIMRFFAFALVLMMLSAALTFATTAETSSASASGNFEELSSIKGTVADADIISAIKVKDSANLLNGLWNSGIEAGHVSNALNSYIVTDLQTGNEYWALHNYDASGAMFINFKYDQAITYNPNIDQYLVYDFDLVILGDYDPKYVFHSIARSSEGLCTGTSFLLSDLSSYFPTGEMKHVTMVYDLNANKSYFYVNNTLAASSDTGVMNAPTYEKWKSGTVTVNQESVRLQNIAANQAIDNVSVRYFGNETALAEVLGSSLSSWSGAVYSSSYSFPEMHAAAIVNGEKVYFEDDVAGNLSTPREDGDYHQVEILRAFEKDLNVSCNAVVETHGLVKVAAPGYMNVTENGSCITIDGMFKELSSIKGTAANADIVAAIKFNGSENLLNGLWNSGLEAGHVSNALNSYVVTDLRTGNEYWALHNYDASGAMFINFTYNQAITYNPSVNQYIVYDFDLAILGDYDPKYVFHSIARSSEGLCSGTSFLLSGLASHFPTGEMKHVTMVYDLNANKSYFYVNNTLAASSDTGVMNAPTYEKWKSGTVTVNQESVRLQNIAANQAIDNVSVRYFGNETALAEVLGSSLSSWSGAVYSSSYSFPEMHAAATVNGEKVYFEDEVAGKLANPLEGDAYYQVEILRKFDTDLNVMSNAVIETHGLVNIKAPGNMNITEDGTCITVEGKGDMSLVTTVKIPSIYQSKMVFQRGEPITVRGYCDSPGSQIEVTLGSNTLTAITDGNGEWEAVFPAMSATVGLTLTVKQLGTEDGKEPINLSDIAIGDVFLLSGQSNMDYKVSNMEDYLELKANANNYHNLRGYLSDNTYRHGEDGMGSGRWYELTADNIGSFPATGYAMATVLAMALGDDVTVAIVEASYPGSVIKTWLDIDLYIEAYGTDTNVINYQNYLAFYEKNGRCPTSAADLSGWVGQSHHQIIASCFDALIAPLRGYKVKAVVWDQGSGDLPRVSEYREHYALLQDSFNAVFGTENVPFIMHNLVPRSNSNYKDFLIEQYNIAASDEHTYLVSMGKDGAVFNSAEWSQNPDLSYTFVHTSRKSPIGYRAANVILENLYGIDADSTPMVYSVMANGSSVIITLTEDMVINYGTKPLLFELAGADGIYHKAEAVLSGNTVTLVCDEVSAPESVRYAYADFVIELNDGTIIEVPNGYKGCTMTSDSLTVVLDDGTTYTINKDAYDSIHSYCTGNVTSVAGSYLPSFELEVGYAAN